MWPNGILGAVLVIVAKAVAMIDSFPPFRVFARVKLIAHTYEVDRFKIPDGKESEHQRKLVLL